VVYANAVGFDPEFHAAKIHVFIFYGLFQATAKRIYYRKVINPF